MVSSLASIFVVKRGARRPSSTGPPQSPSTRGLSRDVGRRQAVIVSGPWLHSQSCPQPQLRGGLQDVQHCATCVHRLGRFNVSHSSDEGPRSGSSRSEHTGNPEVASVTEDPPSIRCEHATPEDACRLARRQSGSAHLAFGRTRGGESGYRPV